MRIRCLFVLLSICWLGSVNASGSLDKLSMFIEQVQTMQGDFVQTVLDEHGTALEVSRGQLMLKKPGKFRWDYVAPYKQQIVCNGSRLWLFDPELEQVTVKPFDQALGATPIALLSGNADLKQQFNFIDLGKRQEGKTERFFVQLEPKVKDIDYDLMLLSFLGSGLDTMELKDKLGRVTRIEFSAVKQNLKIADDHFEFSIPQGVDVIGADNNE